MTDPDADVIRLTLPADEDLRSVVEVTVGVLARRWGLPGEEVTAARGAAGTALVELAGASGSAPVLVEVQLRDDAIEVHLSRGGAERTVAVPPP